MKKSARIESGNVEVPFQMIVELFIAGFTGENEFKYEEFRVVTSGNLIGAKSIPDGTEGPNPHSTIEIFKENQDSGESLVYSFNGFDLCKVDELYEFEHYLLAMFLMKTLLKQAKV